MHNYLSSGEKPLQCSTPQILFELMMKSLYTRTVNRISTCHHTQTHWQIKEATLMCTVTVKRNTAFSFFCCCFFYFVIHKKICRAKLGFLAQLSLSSKMHGGSKRKEAWKRSKGPSNTGNFEEHFFCLMWFGSWWRLQSNNKNVHDITE